MQIRSNCMLARSYFLVACGRHAHIKLDLESIAPKINFCQFRLFSKGARSFSSLLTSSRAAPDCGHNNASFSRFSASTIMPKHHKEFRFADYDIIGFDLDGTLLRYNLNEMVQLEYDLLCRYLVEQKGYSPTLLENKLDRGFLQKGLVLDTDNGNILKLSSSAAVLRATHGTKPMSDAEIIATYGINRTWDVAAQFFKDPLSTWNGPLSEKIRTLLDYFDYAVSLVFGQAIDLVDKQETLEKRAHTGPYKVWPDILAGLIQLYTRENFSNGRSAYFDALRAQPDRYLLRTNNQVIKMLQELRSSGKAVFMLTGSNTDFANFTASYALGPNWQELFDCVVCFAKKPGFFTQQRPYLCVKNLLEVPGSELKLTDTLTINSMYTQGNWVQLRAALAKKLGKSANAVRCLYVGDNLIQDVYTPVKHHDYDAVAICEELLVEDGRSANNYEYREMLASPLWGSYFYDENEPTLWAHIIARYSQLCIPTVDTLAVEVPVMHEFFSKNPEGYFPNAPTVLVP